jgi:hypothetical protein
MRGGARARRPRARSTIGAFVLLAIAAALSGCATAANPLAGMSREERREAARSVSVIPSPVSTLEFKELGDSRRYAIMRQLIKQTWEEDCQPTSATVHGYSPNGSSMWRVRCAGSTLRYDYDVSIPESRPTGARVLKCYQSGPRTTTCTIVPDPRQAAQAAPEVR